MYPRAVVHSHSAQQACVRSSIESLDRPCSEKGCKRATKGARLFRLLQRMPSCTKTPLFLYLRKQMFFVRDTTDNPTTASRRSVRVNTCLHPRVRGGYFCRASCRRGSGQKLCRGVRSGQFLGAPKTHLDFFATFAWCLGFLDGGRIAAT